MKVFDISCWQPNNIVEHLNNKNADGLILRLGYTTYNEPTLDEKFQHFLMQANEYGLPIGIYYYSKMHDYVSMKQEIQFINDRVYDILDGVEPPLGVWLDLEDQITKVPNIHQISQTALSIMKQWYFYQVGIYASYSYFYDFLNLSDIEDKQTPIWVANYGNKNWLMEERPYLNHHGWQFVENYEGLNLDCNEWYREPMYYE